MLFGSPVAPGRSRAARAHVRVPVAVLGFLLVTAGALAGHTAGSAAAVPSPSPGTPVQEGSTAPVQEGPTLTWSVRPTPTEEEPDRPNFAFRADAGDTLEDSIRVRNFGTDPLPLVAYASDALITETGALDLLPAGEESTGVGAWISLETDAVEVLPGEHVDIPFTMTVPEDADSGDHAGGIVTSYTSGAADDGGEPVLLDRRLGSRVHVRVNGELRPGLEVSELSVSYKGGLNPVGTGTLHVAYTVTNTGNIRLAADQVVQVKNLFGLGNREATLERMPELLPSASLSFTTEVPSVWPTFRTRAAVQLEPITVVEGDELRPDERLITTTASTWAVPWPQIVAVLVLVGGPITFLWKRRRRRRREATLVRKAVQAALASQGGSSSKATADDPGPSGPDESNDAEPGDEAVETPDATEDEEALKALDTVPKTG